MGRKREMSSSVLDAALNAASPRFARFAKHFECDLSQLLPSRGILGSRYD